MKMKKIILLVAFACIFIQVQAQRSTNRQSRELIKDIVLINAAPWKVLMNKQGDILSKLSHKPGYLDGYEDKKLDSLYVNGQGEGYPSVDYYGGYSTSEEESTVVRPGVVNSTSSKRETEVYFKKGSATIVESEIPQLDVIAQDLKENPNKKFKIFSFNNEPASKSYILAQRRLDAVLKYLKTKGINTDERFILDNGNVRGKNNKIVFFPLD